MHRKTPERIDNRSSSKEPVALLPTAGEKPLTEEDLEVLPPDRRALGRGVGGPAYQPQDAPRESSLEVYPDPRYFY